MAETHLLKISRLEGLTDGIFAIAMTILAFDLRIPPHLSGTNLMSLMTDVILYKLLIYVGSFIILGTQWVAMNFQLGIFERLNRLYLWTHIYYLMTICIVPFSASLLALYQHSSVSISFYAINLLCASFGQLLIFECGHHYQLYKKFFNKNLRRAIILRILIAPIFYCASLILAHWSVGGAFFCLIVPTLLYLIPGKIDQYESIQHN